MPRDVPATMKNQIIDKGDYEINGNIESQANKTRQHRGGVNLPLVHIRVFVEMFFVAQQGDFATGIFGENIPKNQPQE